MLPLVWGTLYLTGIGLLVAIPLGLLCAIYLASSRRGAFARSIKPVLEVLAGVPTIVFGYFALTFFTPEVLRNALGLNVNQFNALSAGHHPRHPRDSDDRHAGRGRDVRGARSRCARALSASAPTRCRRRSASCSRRRSPGVVAALVLGASRAIGETVIILIAGGQRANLSLNPTESYQSMAAFIAATSRGDIPTGSIEYETIFVVGMTLFVITLLLNIVSIRLVRKYRQVYE